MATELKTTLELDVKPFLDAIKRVANNLKVLEDLRPKININELQRNIQASLNQIRGLNPQINVGLNVDTAELTDVRNQIDTIGQDPVNVEVLVNSEEILTSLNRVRDLRQTAVSIPPQTKLEVDTNAQDVQNDIENIKTDVTDLTSVDNVIKFSVEEGEIQQQIKAIEDSIKRARDFAQGQTLPISLDFEPPTGEAEQRQAIERLKKDSSELKSTVINPEVKVTGLDESNKQLNLFDDNLQKSGEQLTLFSNSVARVPKLATTKTDVVGAEKTISDLNKIEKDVKDIPNQKNVKINVDSAGLGGASKALSGVTGFANQLGSGLLASFSGAAIGAAIANFASQAVRAIVSASDKADELNDKLKLAFTQAGALPGLELDKQLQNANVFALDLADNFGISINRSKELLAQVTGLTGEFGATSEAITKASIGIEEATGGLVKAETAAKLFSRSIGNPEDQAALETLAKRFPAIGEAIKNATDPAEKANAVIANLAGTFTALEEKSRGFGEQFQILSEVAFSTFAAGLVPIFDAFVPILESFRKLIIDNADAIAQFGQQIVTNFVNPLVEQLLALAPQFGTFFEGLFKYFSILGGVSFDVFTTTLSILAPILETVGNLLIVLSPLVQQLADIVSAALVPIFQAFNNELYNSLDPTKQLTDNVFSLNPIIETLSNLVELLNPIMNIFGFIIVNTVVPAVQGLEYALGFALIPFRLLNGAFELGKKLADDFGISIDSLAIGLSKASLLLGPLGFLLSKIIPGVAQIAQTPIQTGGLVRGLGTAAKGFGDLNGLVQNSLEGLDLSVKSTERLGGGLKNLSGASKTATSALQELLNTYQNISKIIEERYNLEIASNDLIIKQQEEQAGRRLTDLEKIYSEQLKITAQQEKQQQLEQNFAKLIGTSADELQGLVEEYLRTGDLSVFPFSFNPKDPKSVEEARRIAETAVKLITDGINIQAQDAEYKFNLKNVELQLDRQSISTQLELLQNDIQSQLTDIQFGRISLQGFDIEGIRTSLLSIRTAAENSLKPFEERIKTTRAEVASLTDTLNTLKESGQTNTEEFSQLQGKLRIAVDTLGVLTEQTNVYRNTIIQTNDTLENLGNTLEEAISNRLQRISTQFDRLSERQEFQITLDLNAEGVRQGLIDIETNFVRSISNIQKIFAQAEARLRVEQNVPVGPLQQADQLAKSQEQALKNLAVQRELAIRQFKQQNDAFFALTQALANNLGNALVPNTIDARRGLNERQKQIDSQLELLRVNLDAELELNKDNLQLRTLSYQEYTEKVLELEKQKSESIKQYEQEVSQARLEALQRIADEALPAIQNQLQLANAELTVLLADGSTKFVDVAEKGLETIGLVAAQSLALAVQQAKSLEDVQKLFLRNIVSGLLKVLRVQLEAAIIGALFTEVQQKSFLGLVTGAIISGVLVGLFAVAEAKILSSIGGFEAGGYTGNNGTKEIAGVVHGQEFVVNASGTKGNRELLEWINKGKSAESFFNSKPNELNVNNFVDTKALNASINGLAYTMDARLSSLENTMDKAIRQNATLTRSANQLDVSVYSDPGTAIKYMKKMGKIKGLT